MKNISKLNNFLNEFQETILYDHPSIPYAYCSILMMNQTTNWIDYDTTEEYTFPIAFPNIQITHQYPPILSLIPKEINAIPIIYRKNLLPIHMNCTLGLIRAFLNQEQEDSPNWFQPTLIPASQWLKENNSIFKEYNHLSSFESPIQNITNQPYPIARLTNISSWLTQNQPPSLIVPNENFSTEIYNENYKYKHLIA
ncbi:261_t:CDS:2, partial [Funneliformis mosseae]